MIVGYCYIVGDILHDGHIRYLRNSKALCDKLICGVLTNKATMEKKPQPILSYEKRKAVIENIKYIDVVVAQTEYSPLKNCKLFMPDILFESLTHKEFPANGFMLAHGKRIINTGYSEGQSSTRIKWKVKKEAH